MGHLLATVNPDAAAAIQPAIQPPPLPPIGSLVVYHMRQGYARNGRTRTPAIVMDHGRGRELMLTVIYDAGDLSDETLVQEYGIGHDNHAWERLDDGRAAAEGLRGTLTSLHMRIGEMEAEMKLMTQVVLGEFKAPAVSIIHIMQDFEQRLAALGRALEIVDRKPGPRTVAAAKGGKKSKRK